MVDLTITFQPTGTDMRHLACNRSRRHAATATTKARRHATRVGRREARRALAAGAW